MLRQPLIVVMGNVDAGKTQLLDTIRKTAVIKSEAGKITQMISSSMIPLNTIQKICGNLLNGKDITIPGVVFIDTPGHAAFSNMRRRGGNLADIAILVININEGVKPQTIECIEILKKYQTPFVIALNKLDIVPGWKKKEGNVLQEIESQGADVKQNIEKKLYEIVGKVFEHGFQAERFDRVDDYTKTIAMVPCSAKTTEGIPTLLMVLMGLSQKFLEEKLKTEENLPGKATVLEVKEEKGIGTTLDLILYEGIIKVNDQIVVAGLHEPIISKVKGIFLPDEKGKYKGVKEVKAASGIKISAPGTKEAIAGMPVEVVKGDPEETKERIQEEIGEVLIETDEEGIVVKADSLGSLEAVLGMLKDKEIDIKKASVGKVTKKDIADATSSEDELNKVILCFNVTGESNEVRIIEHNVIYQLIEDLEKYREEKRKELEAKELENLTKPAKVKVLRGCMFRQSNPCVLGVEVLLGNITPDVDLIKPDGSKAGHVKSVQLENETVKKAEKGKQVAISLPDITGGRQVKEEDILIVDVSEQEFKKLKVLKKYLTEDEILILKEIAEIKRKEKNTWGI
ncbi:translation initiation factor IF-2 [archaeon]|jgi:translation initiation factor 5B|nr:translation initiation factor IF-2 [archaeon]MBT4397353.1 translation initiation factor IF-2 [archaeon]MBT4440733.1 translation initiation factor IF-2 [archaeon]